MSPSQRFALALSLAWLPMACQSETPLDRAFNVPSAPIAGADVNAAEDLGTDAPEEVAVPIDTTSPPVDTTQPPAPADTLPAPDLTPAPEDVGEDAGPLSIGELCFGDIFDPEANAPDYDQFKPTLGSHCLGTNHQEIKGVERVVFLGDSVTVGSPPTPLEKMYRNQLALALADHFGLEKPSFNWFTPNPFDGKTFAKEAGDFASCARWGARTDDLMLDDEDQVFECFPKAKRDKVTLVIMTIGGNDIAALTKDGADQSYEKSLAQTQQFVKYLADTVAWLKDPANFPNGSYVVFANMFEFTDGTGETNACALASLGGFDGAWDDPLDLENLVIWANEQYMKIAVDHGADLIFMLETFCGHGFKHDDPNGRCYRGPEAEQWFDFTCIHPNPTGHTEIAKMFEAVILE